MYEQYYNLRERPFDLSPNPRFLFLSARHREALTHLQYGLSGRPGLTVLIGEAGTGKTTLVRAALQTLTTTPGSIVHLSNPTLSRSEFFEYLAAGFGFPADAATSKTRFLNELQASISSRYPGAQGARALIVDEAQSLPHELLEEVRLLTNVESPTGQTLAVALVGQPELASRLNEPALRQLKQRVALRCELAVLDLAETASYIGSRIRVAGGAAETIFTKDAVVAIHEYSKGIPRTISVICDNALVNGFASDVKPIGRDLILEVCRDFHLADPVRTSVVRPTMPPRPSPAAPNAPRPAAAPRPGTAAAGQPAGQPGTVPESKQPAADRAPMFSGFTRPRRFSFF